MRRKENKSITHLSLKKAIKCSCRAGFNISVVNIKMLKRVKIISSANSRKSAKLLPTIQFTFKRKSFIL